MSKKSISDVMQAGLEEYTGRKVRSIKVRQDPKVAGTWAARAVMADDGQQIDFFCVGNHMPKPVRESSPAEIAEAIEECQFSKWPPPVGPVRFF